MYDDEINQETISKYINSIHRLSICTGKIDLALLYLEQTYPNDKFLIRSLSSILKDITIVNQDNKYERTTLGTHNIQPDIDKTVVKAPENTFRYETTPKILNVPPVSPEIVSDKHIDVAIDNTGELAYKFLNSTNLDEMWYSQEAKLLKVKFRGNQRLYHYISVPENHIKEMIIRDKNNESAGKYFNSNIVKNFEYREASGDDEMVG